MRRAILLALFAALAFAGPPVTLAPDGWFRTANGELFVPLGGFHGNALPARLLHMSREESRRVNPHLWMAQRHNGGGFVDLWDASDGMLRRWFAFLSSQGVTAIRLFPRARVGGDTLDLCGKVNPELQRVMSRTFAAAKPYGIRFLVQILPEPVISGYWNHTLVKRYALPRYSKEELQHLSPSQRRFLIEGKHVEFATWFTDPDVLACQQQYLESALTWIASEPQVFALEVYNEQGQSRPPPDRAKKYPGWEEAEVEWTRKIVEFIHERLPGMPVTISHPGAGVTGFDPIRWSRRTGVDFYSPHFYAGGCGENRELDFAAATAASTSIIRTAAVNFPGEWGVLGGKAPREVRRRAYRDGLWMSLVAGAPGFMQWTYEFLDEYRWASRVFRALPREFSPGPPEETVDIAREWEAYQGPGRSEAALERIFGLYRASLDRGVPLGFRWGSAPVADGAPVTDGAPARHEIEAAGGYQVSYLTDRAHRIWVAYLRSRLVQAFDKHYLGVPVKAPLQVRLDLPGGQYGVTVINIGKGKVRTVRAAANGVLDISRRKTDADYVVVITPGEPVRLARGD